MHPYISIGNKTIASYGLCMVTGIVLATAVSWLLFTAILASKKAAHYSGGSPFSKRMKSGGAGFL